MSKHLVCLIIAVLIASGCRPPTAGGRKSPVTALPPGSFARQWAANLNLKNDPVRELHLEGDRVFVYTRGNQSYVISRAGGALQFINDVDVSGGVLRAPVILGEYLVYPTSSSLEIYNLRGRILKNVVLESPSGASGVGLGNTIYIGINPRGGYGRVVAMDITKPNNVPRWSVLTRGIILGRPAIHDKVIYVGSDDGALVALTDEGVAAWPTLPGKLFSTGGSFITDIYADDTGVYASNTDSKMYVLDPRSGKIKWLYYSSAQLKTPPAVTGTMVYQYIPGLGVAALDKGDGAYNREPKWVVRDATQFLSEDATNAYLKRNDNTLLAVDKQTGKVVFKSKTKKYSVFVPNTTDSTIFAATSDGQIAAIRPVTAAGEMGELVMRFEQMGSMAAR